MTPPRILSRSNDVAANHSANLLEGSAGCCADGEAETGLNREQVACAITSMVSWEWDIPTDQVWLSETSAPWLGLEPGTHLPSRKSWLAALEPMDRLAVTRAMDEALSDPARPDFRLELSVLRPNGMFWICRQGHLIRTAQGVASRMVGTDLDLSELRRAREDRDHHASVACTLIENAPLGIVLVAPDGRIERTNPAYEQLLGYSASELKGRSIIEITAPEDAEQSLRRLNDLEAGRCDPVGAVYEKHYLRKDGQRVRVRVLTGRLGGAGQFFGMVEDLTTVLAAEDRIRELSERLTLATGGQGIGVWDLDVASQIISLDPVCRSLYGFEPHEGIVPFTRVLERMSPEHRTEVEALVSRLQNSTDSDCFEFECKVPQANAAPRWMHVSGSATRDSKGTWLRSVGLNSDVTSHHERTQALQLRATAMNAVVNSMFITDLEGRIVWINEAFSRITGYSSAEAVGKTPRLLKSGRQSEAWYQQVWETIKSGRVWRGRIVNCRKDGELFDVDQTITPIRDESGAIISFVAVHDDVTLRVRAEQRVEHLALYDTLSGLPNRNLFQNQLEAALARASLTGKSLAVVTLDLDHFKTVNDSLGHHAGDLLLKQVGLRIQAELRGTDSVARLGGDEFAVLMVDLENTEQVTHLAERVLATLRRPFEILATTVHLGASIGVTLSTAGEEASELLMRRADLAMYEAKGRGRDCFQFYGQGMDAQARRRFDLESALRAALDDEALYLEYQPQFTLSDGRLCGLEALLRWKHATLGNISPVEFVPLAERCGLGLRLGDWVLRKALRQASDWKRRHPSSVPVAVNMSAAQFEQPGLGDRLEALLREFDLTGQDIELEITESMMLQTSPIVRTNMEQLQKLGLHLAIDDFGTGYSSLLSLRDYPISRLKVDASFVRGIGLHTKDENIIRAVVALGHNLGLSVIAEGVETELQENFLRAEGCEDVQGFRFARPMPDDEVDTLLDSQAREDARSPKTADTPTAIRTLQLERCAVPTVRHSA